jgi:oxygen-dependent protoporphyrinogen oxidase
MNATQSRTRRVVVIGGGIAGLAAAHRLLAGGVRVTVLESSDRLGGKLHAGEIEGLPVDLGAEAMLARRPEAVELARAVGLGDELQAPATVGAALWTRGALRPMPGGHVMGVPGDLAPLAASGVLSDEGLARIEHESDLPPAPVTEDVAVGAYVSERIGREVVDRLVEPLLGGVYAGDAYQISLRAAVPQLYEAAREAGSLTEAVQAVQRRAAVRPAATGPVFLGVDGGIGRLPLAVADAVRAAGGEIVTGAPVTGLSRTAGEDGAPGWRVVAAERAYDADAVVLAAPATTAGKLLGALDGPGVSTAAAELAAVENASMALVTFAFRRADAEAQLPGGSGFLVPSVDGRTIKASTFSSRKWAWAGDDDLFLLRTSLGRHGEEADLKRDDADLVDVSLRDLADATGLAARPVATRVTRWYDGLPQYPVGHLERVERIRASLPAGMVVCGAAYDGVGIPACVASATRAADELLAAPGTMAS